MIEERRELDKVFRGKVTDTVDDDYIVEFDEGGISIWDKKKVKKYLTPLTENIVPSLSDNEYEEEENMEIIDTFENDQDLTDEEEEPNSVDDNMQYVERPDDYDDDDDESIEEEYMEGFTTPHEYPQFKDPLMIEEWKERYEYFTTGELTYEIMKELLQSVFENTKRREEIKSLLFEEFVQFIGLLLTMTFVKLPKLEDYWNSTLNERKYVTFPHFSRIMTFNRFNTIKKYLRFANYAVEMNKNDKLWKIRRPIEIVRETFISMMPRVRKLINK